MLILLQLWDLGYHTLSSFIVKWWLEQWWNFPVCSRHKPSFLLQDVDARKLVKLHRSDCLMQSSSSMNHRYGWWDLSKPSLGRYNRQSVVLGSYICQIMIDLMTIILHCSVKSTEHVDWLLSIRLLLLIWELVYEYQRLRWQWIGPEIRHLGWGRDLEISGNRDTLLLLWCLWFLLTVGVDGRHFQ